MNRRHLMQAATALAAAISLPLDACARAFGRSGAARRGGSAAVLTLALCDDRYSDSRRFAAALRDRGAQVFATRHGVVDLWRDVLGPQASRHEMRIAGLTTRSDLDVIRVCAREAGLKVSYEADHDCRGSKYLTHNVRGFAGEHVIASLRQGRSDWVEALASALAMLGAPEAGRSGTLQGPHRAADHPGFLTSWLIEPVRPAG